MVCSGRRPLLLPLLLWALPPPAGSSLPGVPPAALQEACPAGGDAGCHSRESCSLLQTNSAREQSLLQTASQRSWLHGGLDPEAAPLAGAEAPAPVGAGQSGTPPARRGREVPTWARHLDGWIRREGEILFDVSDRRSFEKPAGSKHPFWVFKADLVWDGHVLVCCVALFLAGLLCSAGGIGGGGIYVTVLMVAGRLSVADAVPLSKAIVFMGSIASLVLNARKQFVSKGTGQAQSLIDYNVCRLVVPCALVGTYLGVLLNRWMPGWAILAVLTALLLSMTVSIVRTTVDQYMEEQAEEFPERVPEPARGAGVSPRGPGPAPRVARQDHGEALVGEPSGRLRDTLSTLDMVVAVFMLFSVVVFSVLRYHAGQCRDAAEELKVEACNHPAVFWLGGGLEHWMRDETEGAALTVLAFLLPLILCSLVALYCGQILVAQERWHCADALKFSSMAIVAGCLAGLVGVGGGLIFAPFFLLMGLEPSIAVATSSTCVIFTSSSTTMQYILTDRVIMSLALVYGFTNLVASYTGTRFVHFLQDTHLTRKSMISAIVSLGVLISTALAVVRLVEGIVDGFQVDVH